MAADGWTKADGRRLRAIRAVTSRTRETQGAFAHRMGFEGSQWNNWETGHSRISITAAMHLCQVNEAATLDWIYFGKDAGVPKALAAAMEAFLAQEGVRRRPL